MPVGSCPQAGRGLHGTWSRGGRQVLLSPVTAPGKKSVCGDRHHSGSGQVSPAGGRGPQGGRRGAQPGGRPARPAQPVSVALSLVQPLHPAAARLLPERWRPGGQAGGLACWGRAYSSPHPQEVTSSHSLQGGVGARILGSRRRMESAELRGGVSGGWGSGTAGGWGSSPVSVTSG